MTSTYKLTDHFLSNNVKLLSTLDKTSRTFNVPGHDLNDHISDYSRSPSPTGPDDTVWSMPSADYFEIRDHVIGALVADANRKFDTNNPSLIFDLKSEVGVTFGQHLVKFLCRDLRANLIEFTLEDLDRLGLDFYNQYKVEREKKAEEREERKKRAEKEAKRKAKKEARKKAKELEAEEAKNDASNNKPKDGGQSKNENEGDEINPPVSKGEEEGNDDDGEPEQNKDEKGYLANFYFGTPKPNGKNADSRADRRNKKALDTLLDCGVPKTGAGEQPLKAPCNGKTPLIIFVHGTEKMLDLNKGWRLISRLRNAVRERREAGIPIFGVFFWMGTYSNSRVDRASGAGKTFQVPRSVTERKEWRTREAAANRTFNRKALKETLQNRYSYLVDESIVGGEVHWELEGMEELDSIMSREKMDTNELDRIAKSIAARSWGKPKIDLRDISEVLNKIESDHRGKMEKSRPAQRKDMPELTADEQALDKYVIAPGQSPITYDDVIMDPVTKATVRQFVALSRMKITNSRSSLFSYFKMPGILLFGPPGTGKTHLCRAIANDSGHTFMALSAAELNGCYVGETEKAIRAMFSLARKLHPCILFLDEVDSLFYRRAGNDKSWERSALAQYLQEMDGLAAENSTNKAPLVIVATNRPGDLDEAFLRRLPYRVLMNMPSEKERQQILEKMLPPDNLADGVDLADIARRSEGFSGSDLRTLCGQAALSWATELDISTGEAFEGQEIKLSLKNFDLAFSRTGPSASPDLIETLENFHRRFQN
ncbi:hypothetical protein TWF281_009483 [Arthrobotrys megalospora]